VSIWLARLVLVATAFVPLSCSVGEEEALKRIHGALTPLPHLLAADPSGNSAQEHLQRERLPDHVLQSFFHGVPGAPHEDSPERQQRVAKVEEAMSSFESALISLVRTTKANQKSPNAVMVLIQFAKPTNALRQALLDVAQSPNTPVSNAALAYDALFRLQLDDEELHRDVLQRIGQRDEFHTRARLGADLLTRASTDWALAQLEPLYTQFLSTPCKPENYPRRGGRARLVSYYLRAAEGLSRFGLLSQSNAALCRARIAELDPRIEDESRVIGDLTECLERLEGKRVPKLAVNVKSRFLGVSAEAYRLWKKKAIRGVP
jgi:hypothetical protein